jgi:hypothetical protein
MSQDNSVLPVPFHGATLALIEHNGEPFAAMRPIVEAMGLDWASQFVKLKANQERWGVVEITTPSAGGMQKTLCMPVRKLAAFFANIYPNKVAPALRDRIRQYQEECDNALWSYWTQGHAIRSPGQPTPADPALPVPPVDPFADPKVRSAINRKAHALSLAAFEHNRDILEAWLRRCADITNPEAAIERIHSLDLDHGKHVVVDLQLIHDITSTARIMHRSSDIQMQAITRLETAVGRQLHG